MPLPKPTAPAAIDPVPSPVPLRTDRNNFATRGDAMMEWFETGPDDIDTSVAYVNDAVQYVEQEADSAETSATAAGVSAAAAAASAASSTSISGTSATSVAIGTGSKSFTASTGRGWVTSQFLTLASSADNTKYMHGQVTSYNSGTGALVMNITDVGGTGTLADWLITVSAPRGATGATGGLLTLVVETGTSVTGVAGTHHALTNVGLTTVTLPGSPIAGSAPIRVTPCNALTTNVIARNGNKIMSLSEDMTLDNASASVTLEYINSTVGWRIV